MRRALLLSAALLSAASCSDSTAPPIALTDQEVGQLFGEIASASGIAMGSHPAPNGAQPSGAAASSSGTFSSTADCARGGTVGVKGTATGGGTSASFDVTETFYTCTTETFTLGGSVHLDASVSVPNDSTFTVHEVARGVVTVEHKDGRSGTCVIDVTVDVSGSGQNFSASAVGTVCGRNASVIASSVSG